MKHFATKKEAIKFKGDSTTLRVFKKIKGHKNRVKKPYVVGTSFEWLNVPQLTEGREFNHKTTMEALNLNIPQNFLRSSKPLLLVSCCYAPVRLISTHLIRSENPFLFQFFAGWLKLFSLIINELQTYLKISCKILAQYNYSTYICPIKFNEGFD